MNRSALLIVALALTTVASCWSGEPTGGGAPAPSAAGSEEEVARIPMLPGYKYYAGGPILKRDAHGRYRIQKFDGEVEQPPSRGMIFGAKVDGDKMEYRVWANGKLIAVHRGTFRDGVFWQDYAEGYRGEKLTSRERDEHLDDQKKTKAVLEDIDPETGEVIRVTEFLRPYTQPKVDAEEEEGDEAEPAAGEP